MPYICASTAKQTYRLSERDLEDLECMYVKNPHYSSAAPMRLYDEDEVRDISEEKASRLQYEHDHAEEIKAQKNEEKKRVARELAAKCKQTIDSWNSSERGQAGTYNSRLSLDLWSSVLIKLSDDIELDGVRGVSVVARDICNACLSCPDMKAASHLAFKSLADRCPSLPTMNDDPDIWNQFILDPVSVRLDVMKRMARDLGLAVGGNKPVVVCRLFEQFGIEQPSVVPAKVLHAIHSEKSSRSYPWALGTMCTTIWLGSSPNGSVFRLRKTLMNLGITTLSALRVRYEDARVVELARQKEREKQAEERAKALFEKSRRVCTCGNAPAATCSFQRCAKCCQGPCVRHQKGL